MRLCHKCRQEWTVDKKRPGFKETCPNCNAYLHSCKNCRYYEPSAHNSCRIPTTDWVPDKEKANFCEDFEFTNSATVSPGSSKKEEAKETFEDLFGGTLKNTDQDAPTDFDSLFGD